MNRIDESFENLVEINLYLLIKIYGYVEKISKISKILFFIKKIIIFLSIKIII